MIASLYIHIPFCNTLCDYCDFYSVTTKSLKNNDIDNFLSVLITEIKNKIDYFNVKEIPTVYIGGGTPSVLGKKIRLLFDVLKAIPSFKPVEFTIEANPESISEVFLGECIDGGVNRLSLGVQTFHEPSRFAVNRGGNKDIILKQLTLASNYFSGDKTGKTLSIDLITGLPYQNEKIVTDDIKRVLDFSPVHISLYSLSVEKDTVLEKKINDKTLFLPANDYSDNLWLTGRDSLIHAGFEHYEVSNFALPQNRCLHNIRYWQMDNWLGAGPTASGTIINEKNGSAKRFTNEKLGIRNEGLFTCEELDRNSLMKETLLMGFRCKEGPDTEKFYRRFGCKIDDCIPQTIKRWEGKDKMLFLNSFLTEAFAELD
ncbi:MAG: radical SAM family heme chaperone HemW [Treponema sp.]|nr:radical SAM family heme chaperone HemW [Treponema sp.]